MLNTHYYPINSDPLDNGDFSPIPSPSPDKKD